MAEELTPAQRRFLFRGERRRRRLALDTMCFLYRFEANPDYLDVTRDLFELIERGECAACASALALMESLVLPMRLGRIDIASAYRSVFATFPSFDLLPLDAGAAEKAAELRARYGIRTPDALHLATAIGAGADAFVSTDPSLARVSEIEVLLLQS